MKSGDKFYRGCFRLARAAIGIFYRIRVYGVENIPAGGAMVCANHSSNLDPFLIAFAFGIENHMYIIAKIELFRIPVISQVLRKLGMISVDRGTLDISTIKKTYKLFDKGQKVVIFPEGTRVHEAYAARAETQRSDGEVSAKSGAVKLAERKGIPVVPVYIPRKKPVFRRVPVIIDEPYYIRKLERKRTAQEYEQLADDMMARIEELGVRS